MTRNLEYYPYMVLKVSCVACGAGRGERCRRLKRLKYDESGNVVWWHMSPTNAHKRRKKAYQEAWDRGKV